MIVKNFSQFNENKNESTYKPINLIHELCTCMVLLNPKFLDSILDRGIRARYQENTDVFINDLKHLLTIKNRLKLGKFVNNKCEEDENQHELLKVFDNLEFTIDEDFQILVNARNCARNIVDKMIPGDKLTDSMIEFIYWIGPNQTEEYKEDIVIQLHDGRQFSFFLNKNINMYKTAAFNTFADELIGNEFERLFSPEYITKWNFLTKRWLEIIYENANKNIQNHIEKFIEPSKISNITYFAYLDIKHSDPRYKHLGEYMREFDDNILSLVELMSNIWKNKDTCFENPEDVYKQWMEVKILNLNSRILEHLLTEALTKNNNQDIEKLEDGNKLASGKVKMKILKTIVTKLGCKDRNIYYLGNNGNILTYIPTLKFWREAYSVLDVKFDYHQKLNVNEEERENDFKIYMYIDLLGKPLMNCEVGVSFTRSKEFGGNLSARYKFNTESDFNERIHDKMIKND